MPLPVSVYFLLLFFKFIYDKASSFFHWVGGLFGRKEKEEPKITLEKVVEATSEMTPTTEVTLAETPTAELEPKKENKDEPTNIK